MKKLAFALTTVVTLAGQAQPTSQPIINSDLSIESAHNAWEAQTHVFGCNETQFNLKNVVKNLQEGTVGLKISDQPSGDRQYSGGEIKYVGLKNSKTLPEQSQFSYGRVSASIKTARFPGTVSSLFLYRYSPWQEIDIEFLGSNPRKIQFNVYFNQGVEGESNNDYTKDSPVQMDLPFDASEDFHEYTIDWSPGQIRWYVDGKLYRELTNNEQVPYLPMTLRMNHWGVCDAAADWSGAHFDTERLKKGETPTVEYKWIKVWQY